MSTEALYEIDTLNLARERVSMSARWTRGAPARTAGGEPCEATSPMAQCWSARGALLCSLNELLDDGQECNDSYIESTEHCHRLMRLMRDALKCLHVAQARPDEQASLIAYNDAPARTHREILRLFEVATSLARKFASDAPWRVCKPAAHHLAQGAGCWALVLKNQGSASQHTTNCGNRPRPDHLTCTKHQDLEPFARAANAKATTGAAR